MNLRNLLFLSPLLLSALVAADPVTVPMGSAALAPKTAPSEPVVLDIRRNKPTRPGHRAFQPDVITTVPFTPLSRLSGSSLEYLLPLIQPKISGVTVAGDASSFSYDGKEIYVGSTIKYPRRSDMNLSAYFTDTPVEKPAHGPAVASEGVLRVRSIHSDRIIFIDDAGYELPVPVNINNEDDQTDASEQPLRVQMSGAFAVGVLMADGERVLARLPLDLPQNSVLRISTRFATQRAFVLERYADGVAILHVDGEALVRPKAADIVPLPRLNGWYALGARGGEEGFDLLGLPLDRKGDTVRPRSGAFDASMVATMPVWADGTFQGFADEGGHLLPTPLEGGEKSELCIVIYSTSTP